MKTVMKKLLSLACSAVLMLALCVDAFAAEGNVTYSGNSGEFIFAPGTMYSPTDLFPDFKGVMPGDAITQKITLRNNADKKVKVKIYMRSLGADDAASQDFLSQMTLTVKPDAETPLFEANADETAQLTDWVCLGLLYSGGEVDISTLLNVPIDMDNEYMNRIGYLDWQFMVEEFPVESGDPKPPRTGDYSNIYLWIGLAAVVVIIILLIPKRRKEEEEVSN